MPHFVSSGVLEKKQNPNGWWLKVHVSIFYICMHKQSFSAAVFFRCEIEATLERLKKLERDLSTKEQELKEREQRLKMWERKLIEQSSSPVSSLLVPLHLAPPFSLGTDKCS